MSLVIKTETGQSVWYVGGQFDVRAFRKEAGKALAVHADGDELARIVQRLPNIPHAYSYCTWTGELAQFIVDNINNVVCK